MEDLVGKKFNRLTVLGDSGQRTSNRKILYYCTCMCGSLAFSKRQRSQKDFFDWLKRSYFNLLGKGLL